MKRKFYLSMPFLALMVIGLIYACKRTEGMEPAEASKQLSNKTAGLANTLSLTGSNWLSFTTLDAFNSTMKTLHEKYQGPEALAKWESANTKKGFISLRRLYELTDADTSEKRTAPTVDSLIRSNKILDCPDSWFATLLSKDGFIQIADTVYSFRPGNKNGEAYAVPARSATELLNGTSPERIAGSKVHITSFFTIPIPRWGEIGTDTPIGQVRLQICSYPSTSSMLNWWGQVGGDIYGGDDGIAFPEHNGRQVKLQYQRWRVGYIFYASAGVRVKMLKHTRFAGWQSVTYANEMMMEACCKGKVFIPGFPLIGFNEQTSPSWPSLVSYAENNFEKTLKWTATGLMNDILLDHFNFHFRVNYRDRIVERYIRQ